MPITETPLAGTELLTPERLTAFSDRYHRQHAQSLAWLQRALREKAQQRDKERIAALSEQVELRRILAEITGAAQLHEAQSISSFQDSQGNHASLYTITTPSGLHFTGQFFDPPGGQPRGVVVTNRSTEWLAAYVAQGLRVVVPFLAQDRHSFAGEPERRWYHFYDSGLLNLFFFIVGGSLAGLEATELNTLASHFRRQGNDLLPVALDIEGRQTVTAAVATALATGLPEGIRPEYKLLVLHDDAELLDHQETDLLVNTIWRFHVHFDALSLFTLSAPTGLLFVDPTPTPSVAYSRAAAWFAQQNSLGTKVNRLAAPSPVEVATAVAQSLAGENGFGASEPPRIELALSQAAGDALYREALESKLAFLKKLHTQAADRRKARYDLSQLTPEEYRQRVAESIVHVAGSPLPEAEDSRPRTRLVRAFPAYDLYEVALQGVAGVETAGYLLLPNKAEPRPAIICQHGLGGRPETLAGYNNELEGGWVYDRFAQRLAEKGYVVYAPFMNWGLAPTEGRDKLVKHAYALGWSANRFEVAQLHAIVSFLQSRPEVIPSRVAFYGLSYGGHASVWLCSQEPRLCAVVTTGHFNDWHRKLTTLELSPPLVRPTSYISVDEGYDMFNYDMLNQLNHAQMITRYVPRPHMVENGLFDAVSPTAWVNEQFATVQATFDWLNASDQTELEHFDGPHRVWSERAFGFLHRHLNGGA